MVNLWVTKHQFSGLIVPINCAYTACIIDLFMFSPDSFVRLLDRTTGKKQDRRAAVMGILQQEMPTQSGRYPSFGAQAGWHLPSGWWIFPGVVLGFGMWVMIGYGVHAALTHGTISGQTEVVTQSAPLGIGIAAPD
jgi:hypothetical protein